MSNKRKLPPSTGADLLDEFSQSSALKGVLSFLTVRPAGDSLPGTNLTTDGKLPSFHPDLAVTNTATASSPLSQIEPLRRAETRVVKIDSSLNDSLPDYGSPPDNDSLSGYKSHPDNDSLPGYESPPDNKSSSSHLKSNSTFNSTRTQVRKPRPATKAQHGHSRGEDRIWWTLWNYREAKLDGNASKTVQVGLAEISRISGIHKKNVRIIMRSLRDKLAIDWIGEHSSEDHGCRTYRVWSKEVIVARRQKAGMTHFIMRGTKPILLGVNDSLLGNDSPPGNESLVGNNSFSASGYESHPAPANDSLLDPGYDSYPLKESLKSRSLNTSSSSLLAAALRDQMPEIFWDQKAIDRLWDDCQGRAENCTADYVAQVAKQKLALKVNNIQNPVGFLLTCVPEAITTESYAIWARDREKEQVESAQRAQEAELQAKQYQEQKQAREENKRLFDALPTDRQKQWLDQTEREYRKKYPQLKDWQMALPGNQEIIRRTAAEAYVKFMPTSRPEDGSRTESQIPKP